MKFTISSLNASRTIYLNFRTTPETNRFLIKFLYEIRYFQPWRLYIKIVFLNFSTPQETNHFLFELLYEMYCLQHKRLQDHISQFGHPCRIFLYEFNISGLSVSKTILPFLSTPPEAYQFLIKFLPEVYYFQPWHLQEHISQLQHLPKCIIFK